MKTIVAAIDFSDVADKVIATARELAIATNARIEIVHAAAPDPTFVGYEAGPQSERNLRAATLVDEHKRLNEIAEILKQAGLNATCFLTQGPTADVILEKVEESKADFLVVGSHGHGAVYSLVAGNVTLQLLKRSRIPVVVVPAPS